MSKKEESVGYVPINRKFFNHPLWKEERTFSKAEAWLDLIQQARFEDSTATALIGGVMVSWTRGQLPGSLRFLADRWKWDKNKVDRFLKLLEDELMIKRIVKKGQTIIELTNFSVHNQKGQKTGQHSGQGKPVQASTSEDEQDTKRDSERDEGGTAAGQGRDKTNNVNKENNGNNETTVGASAPVVEKPKTLYQKFVSHYFDFFKNMNDGESPMFEKKHGEALKSIIRHLKKSVESKAKMNGKTLTEEQIDVGAEESFKMILDEWDSLSEFSKQQTDICSMNSQFNRIMTDFKNKRKKNGSHQQAPAGGAAKAGTSAARIEAARNWGRR